MHKTVDELNKNISVMDMSARVAFLKRVQGNWFALEDEYRRTTLYVAVERGNSKLSEAVT